MQDFEEQLRRWGPAASFDAPSLAEAEAFTRRLALGHYENFPVVTWLLPRRLHQHFYNVYAFCRWSDDLGDEAGSPDRARELLTWWQAELEHCYRGQTTHPIFVALAPTIEAFQLPIVPFADLISAFQQDQIVRRYNTFAELRDYCRRSADPVGRLVLRLFGSYRDETVTWADSICTGLQLTNFWQDVARDAQIDRCYLPREDRLQFGYSDEDWTARRTTPGFLQLMEFEVDRARTFLLDGRPLIGALPREFRMDIDLFIQGGLCVLDKITAQGYRVWEQRPKVSKWELSRLFFGSLGRSWWSR